MLKLNYPITRKGSSLLVKVYQGWFVLFFRGKKPGFEYYWRLDRLSAMRLRLAYQTLTKVTFSFRYNLGELSPTGFSKKPTEWRPINLYITNIATGFEVELGVEDEPGMSSTSWKMRLRSVELENIINSLTEYFDMYPTG